MELIIHIVLANLIKNINPNFCKPILIYLKRGCCAQGARGYRECTQNKSSSPFKWLPVINIKIYWYAVSEVGVDRYCNPPIMTITYWIYQTMFTDYTVNGVIKYSYIISSWRYSMSHMMFIFERKNIRTQNKILGRRRMYPPLS